MVDQVILDNVTINQPVADLTALAAIPTGSLVAGCVCFVVSENAFYEWNGAAWVKRTIVPPASSTLNALSAFADTSGTILKDTGVTVSGGSLNVVNASGALLSGLTASELTATDASKNLQSLGVATYPSLAEIAYVKGVTSAIQTQLNTKVTGPALAVTDNSVARFDGTTGTLVKSSALLLTDGPGAAVLGATAGTSITVTAPNAAVSSLQAGSNINLNAGFGDGSGAGGEIGLYGGQSATGLGGNVILSGGTNTSGSAGGDVIAITGLGSTRGNFKIQGDYTATLSITALAANRAYTFPDAAGTLALTSALSDFVTGPASATSTALVKFNGTTGKLVQNTGVSLDGSNNFTGMGTLNGCTLPAATTLAGLTLAQIFNGTQSTAQVTITSSAGSVATDCALTNNFKHTMTENTTLANPTNKVTGAFYTWEFIQGAGPYTLAFGSDFKWANGVPMIVSTGNGAKDIITGYYDGTNILTVISGQNFS